MLFALLFHKQRDLSPWNLLNAALRFKFLKLWPFVFLFLLTAELCRHLLLRVLQQLHSKRQAWGTRCFERSPASHRIVQEGQGWTQASGVAGETTTNFSVAQKRAHLYLGGGGEGGGGEGFTRFYTGRLHPERGPPPYPIVYHFGGKDTLRLSYIVQVNEQYYGRTSSMSRRDVNQKVYFIQLRLWQEWRWQISLPFHILRLVNSLPLYIAEASPYSPWLDGVALPLASNREVYPLCDIM